MASIDFQPAKRKGSRLPYALQIDMTPMVDLGFLLITFFIFTTALGEKTTVSLIMPVPDGPPAHLSNRHALTLVLGDNDLVYAYEGNWEEALAGHKILETNYNQADGVGKLIREKQKQLLAENEESKDDLMLLIKPLKEASYKNMIDALDEATINRVRKYAVIDPSIEEASYILQKK